MPWKKGQSGNPGGRPKSLSAFTELARAGSGKALEALINAAKQGDIPAVMGLLAYAWGKPATAPTDLSQTPTAELVAELDRRHPEITKPEEESDDGPH